jgi:hypothetical protein
MNKNLWLSWEVHTRSRSISSALNIKLIELISNKPSVGRYIFLSIKTILILFKQKPEVLIVQNPSIVLSYISVIFRPLIGYKLIMDCHNAALVPLEGKYPWLVKLAQFLINKAKFVIVTNEELAKQVFSLKGAPIILNDPIPEFDYEKSLKNRNDQPKVTLIATWAEDEPIKEFLDAVAQMENLDVYVTGRLKEPELKEKYNMVNFTGFLSRSDYIKLISSSDLIVDLTTRENCLVCGAYEAVGVGVPLLLSNTLSLRSTFDLGAEFCDNDVDSIIDGINSAISNIQELKDGIKSMKEIHMDRWEKSATKLLQELSIDS